MWFKSCTIRKMIDVYWWCEKMFSLWLWLNLNKCILLNTLSTTLISVTTFRINGSESRCGFVYVEFFFALLQSHMRKCPRGQRFLAAFLHARANSATCVHQQYNVFAWDCVLLGIKWPPMLNSMRIQATYSESYAKLAHREKWKV